MGLRDDPRPWAVRRRAIVADDRRLDELAREAKAVAEAVLEAAGYHRHARGAWRLKRGGTETMALPATETDLHDRLTLARGSRDEARRLFDQFEAGSTRGAELLIKLADGDLPHRMTEAAIRRFAPEDELQREAIRRGLARVRRDLEGPGPVSAAEALIIERAVACHLAVQVAEAALARAEKDRRAMVFDLKRLESAQRRLLGVLKALDQMRRKTTPAHRVKIRVEGDAHFGAAPPGETVIDLGERPVAEPERAAGPSEPHG